MMEESRPPVPTTHSSNENDGIYQVLNMLSLPVVQERSYTPNNQWKTSKLLEDQEKVDNFLRIELSNLRAEKYQEINKIKSELEVERNQRIALSSKMERLINFLHSDVTKLVSNLLWLKLTSDLIESTVFQTNMSTILKTLEKYMELSESDNLHRLEQNGRILEQINRILNTARIESLTTNEANCNQSGAKNVPQVEENLVPVLQMQSNENKEIHQQANRQIPEAQQNNLRESEDILCKTQGRIRSEKPNGSKRSKQELTNSVQSAGLMDSTQQESDRNRSPHKEDVFAASKHACICGTTFANSKLLKVHMKTATSGKIFKCHLCSRIFGNNSHLTRHIRNVHKRRIGYKCFFCNEIFSLRNDFYNHRQKHCEKSKKCLTNIPPNSKAEVIVE